MVLSMERQSKYPLMLIFRPMIRFFFLSLVVIGKVVTATPDQAASALISLTVERNANVRNQPSLSSAVVTVLPIGATVKLLARTEDWFYVFLPDGANGWINQITLGELPSLKSSQTVWFDRTTAVYSEPRAASPKITTLFTLQPVNVILQQGNWRQVYDANWIGWVEIVTSTEPAVEQFYHGRILTGKSGNIRQYPDLQAPIIGKVAAGDSVRVIGIWKEWYHIVYRQSVGYINNLLILSETLTPLASRSVKVVKDGNLRARPSLNAQVIGEVKTGQSGYVLTQQSPWNQVFFPPATVGWVNDLLLEITTSPIATVPSPSSTELSSLIEVANRARHQKKYPEALDLLQKIRNILNKPENLAEAKDCLQYYQACVEYALAEQFFYPYGQAKNPIVKQLQSADPLSNCYSAIQRSLMDWKQGFEFYNQLMGLFSQKEPPIEKVVNTLEHNPTILPLTFEAEARRYLGRYYQNQAKPESALGWQKECVSIYRSLYEHNLLNSPTQLSNYFDALIELAEGYYRLGKIHPSMAVLDDVYALLQKNYREDWNKRYLKMVDLVTSAPRE